MSNAKAPAFPFVEPENAREATLGLSKLEYFAGLAMQGFVANTAFTDAVKNNPDPVDDIAAVAVRQARALLSELSKESEQ